MTGLRRLLPAALLIGAATPALASEEEARPLDARTMERLEKDVPPQSWYPDGYYDVRIAAETQVAETLRTADLLTRPCDADSGRCYDPSDSVADRIDADESDPGVIRYGSIALEVARLRQEMGRIGYPAAVYEAPLAAFERKLVEAVADKPLSESFENAAARDFRVAVETNRLKIAPKLPYIVGGGPDDDGAKPAGLLVVRMTGPSARRYPAGTRLKAEDKLILAAGDTIVLVQGNGVRTLKGPGVFKPENVAQTKNPEAARLLSRGATMRSRGGFTRNSGPSGAAPQRGVVVMTSPPGAEVLLINGFSFKVCTRKQPDPWDRFACKWNEVETGIGRPLSGRYVYQVRWPDGTLRKGTREIIPDYDAGASVTVTFRKTGS